MIGNIGTLSIGKLAIQLTTPLLLHKPYKRFASVARVCQRQLAFLVIILTLFCRSIISSSKILHYVLVKNLVKNLVRNIIGTPKLQRKNGNEIVETGH